jgi:hypothetical protein
MNYKVWIAAHKDGFGVIGSANIDSFGSDIADKDQVYGIQIGHRVVAKTPEGYRIMTPTEANSMGYESKPLCKGEIMRTKVVTTARAAELLGMTRSGVRRACRHGRFVCWKMGRDWLLSLSKQDLEFAWLRGRPRKGTVID